MAKKDLDSVAILGLGLLGGSLGLAVNRLFANAVRFGYSHRAVTRRKAMQAGAIDVECETAAEAVAKAKLVVLASPIGIFEDLMAQIAEALPDGAVVTDVGSTKVLPVRWARRHLPSRVEFIGSHPMAGSEQRGVEFARADLFDDAHCILTPTAKNQHETVQFLEDFWLKLGMRVCRMNPAKHDKVLARISHLPDVLAAALIGCSDADEMLLCGKGFLDTTRIASGPPGVWRDILTTNAANVNVAIERTIKELRRAQAALQSEDDKAIMAWLAKSQSKRNDLVEKKLLRKELPA